MEAINFLPASWDGLPVPLSASMGAAVRHDNFESSDLSELFVAADQCMYEAKHSRAGVYRIEFGTGVHSSMTLVQRPGDLTTVPIRAEELKTS
jgi:GGDEF domain-containing protein